MLLFSTVLEMSEMLTKRAFVELVLRWNRENPREENRIAELRDEAFWPEFGRRYGSEAMWIEFEDYAARDVMAVRFEKVQANGVVWDTDYVMDFAARRMAVRLDRSFTEEALKREGEFSTPHFISYLVWEGYLAADGALAVQRTPHFVTEANAELAAAVINGTDRYRLPVVFVSATMYGDEPVDVDRLAGRLKGIAHVLVQQGAQTGARLRDLCESRNEYHGAIGLYFPDGSHRRFLYRSSADYDEHLEERVITEVLRFSNARRAEPLLTWQGVNSAILHERLTAQRAERQAAEEKLRRETDAFTTRLDGANKALHTLQSQNAEFSGLLADANQAVQNLKGQNDEYSALLDGADDEIDNLKSKNTELTNKIYALECENQGLKNKLDALNDVPLLLAGDDECDLYPGELQALVLAVLREALADTLPDSRRRHVLEDVLAKNPPQVDLGERAEELKRILKTYSAMSTTVRNDLIAQGFGITDDGKHYKLIFHGDERYIVSCSKTPSDARTGKNLTQQIIRKIF